MSESKQIEITPFEDLEKSDRRLLDDACTMYVEYNRQIREIKAKQKKEFAKALKRIKTLDLDKILADDWYVTKSEYDQQKIDPIKLLQMGVSQKIIEKCTNTKPIKKFSVGAPKAEKDDEEESDD